MTKSIKNNLIRFLTFIVAVTCAFSILTMPKTSAMADVNTVGLDKFAMETAAKLNVTSPEKSGIQFTAKGSYNWTYPSESMTGADSIHNTFPKRKKVMFGIVIADKYYRDENGDIQERTNITVETDNAITISYLDQEHLDDGGYYTGGWTYYTGSITYREDKLKADFIAHDKAVRAGEKPGNCYFSVDVHNANYEGELFDEEFADIMDKVHAEQLIARAYIKVTTAEDETVYVYSENSVSNSVRGVATDKYIENKDDASWMAQYGYIATKYLGTVSTKSAYLDKQTNKIIGQDLRGYEEFAFNDASLSVGEDIVVGETSTLNKSIVDGLEVGQTYSLTAKDSRGNILFLNVTPATEVITSAEQFKSIFNLSTNNTKFCKPVASFYTCTVDGYYVLGNDINMDGVQLDHNLVCVRDTNTVSAAYGIGFYGTFDGNGYTISNLDLRRPSAGVYAPSQNGNFMIAKRDESGVLTGTTSSYYINVGANHNCSHDSSATGAGLFGVLGYGTSIKNVALTNVNASTGSVIASIVEGAYTPDNGANTYNAFGGFEEVDSTGYAMRYSSATTCTSAAGCPVHDNDTASCDGGYYVKCSGAPYCILHQTHDTHDAVWFKATKIGSYYYVDFATDTIMLRKGVMLTAEQAKITYENLYIDVNSSTTNFRGVFNNISDTKVDKITTMNNIVINYNGATANSSNNAILRGYTMLNNKGGDNKAFQNTVKNNVVVIADTASNLVVGSFVASNLEGTNKVPGVLQYASLEEYAAAIEATPTLKQGFGSYWETEKTQTPTWKNDFTKVTFKVDGEVVGNSFDYTTLALGEQKTFQVTAYDYKGDQITEFAVAKTTDELVATVNKSGLITVEGSTNKTEASTIITLEANGKTFIATITIQGGFTLVEDKEVTYSQDQGRFNFNYAVQDDDGNDVVFNNDTILSATVIYGDETIELTKQEIQIRDYGTLANGKDWTTNPGGVGNSSADSGNGYSTTGDQATNPRYDSTKPFNAFLGENVVKFAVKTDTESGIYEPTLHTQQLLVKIQVGEEVRTYVFNNFKAYSAIITNVGQLSDVLAIKSNGQINKGYYVLVNNIKADRGGYQIQHVSNLVSTGGFQGVFDGQGYQIDGLRPSVTNTGLFGRIISTEEMATTIRNISLVQYDASLAKPVVLAGSIMSDVYEDIDAGDTKIQVAKYPAEIYNVHNKVTTKTYNGLIGAEAGKVNYKFRNVLVNLEVFNEFFAKDKNISLYTGAGNSALVAMPNYGSNDGRQVWDMRDFARDAYYTDAYKNVVVFGGPLMTYLKNSSASNGYTNFDPVETLYLSYGMNKLNKAGIKLSPVVPLLPSNKTPTNVTAAQLIVLESQKELTVSNEMPYATELANKTYTLVNPENAEDSKTYVTTEQAFLYKGVHHYYNNYEMVAQYNNEESGEKAMFDGFVSTGYFVKRTTANGYTTNDSKLIWAVAGATN